MVPQYLVDCQLGVALGGFAGLSLHLADELTTESVDDTGDRGLLTLADEVEVKHALDGLGLHSAEENVRHALGLRLFRRSWSCACSQHRPMENSLDETSCLGVEELVVGLRSECSAGRSEACDVVVGRGGLAVGHSSRCHFYCVYERWGTVGRWEGFWERSSRSVSVARERCFEPSPMPSTGSRKFIVGLCECLNDWDKQRCKC